MVETGAVWPPSLAAARAGVGLGGSMGMPLPGVRVQGRRRGRRGGRASAAVGELLVHGPGVLKGYQGDAEATGGALTDDGWLRTGDLARRGPLGIVLFEGRMKDVIKRGGYSVYAVEVEQALEEHPDVARGRGGRPARRARRARSRSPRCACADGTTLDALDLPAWAAERLAGYKVPVRFVAVDDLPRTGTNKVQRREVLALVTE